MRNMLYDQPDLYERAYPDPNGRRASMCLRVFRNYLEETPGSVLDIGCGTGRDVALISERIADCVGVDPSERMVGFARAHCQTNAVFTAGDIQTLRLGRRFDAVLALGNVLAYMVAPGSVEQALQTLRMHTQDGGLLILNLASGMAMVARSVRGERQVFRIDHPEGTATGLATFELDRRRQQVTRYRDWHVDGRLIATDRATYRLFFPDELTVLLKHFGFQTLAVADNPDLEESSFEGDEMTLVARCQG